MHFPLTLSQTDIYLDQVRRRSSPLYNVGGYIDLHGVDISRLTRAHCCLVSYFDIFGLRITLAEGGISQYISGDRNVSLALKDFSHAIDPVRAAGEWQTSLFETVLDIEDSGLFRVYLAKIAEDHYRYVGLAHHLMMDGRGFSNWASLLCRLYNDPSGIIPPGETWRPIALDDQKYLAGEKYRKDRHYWAARLGNIPPLLFTPRYQHQFPDPLKIPSHRKIIEISRTDFNNIQTLARGVNAGVSQHFLAMLALYFANSSGQNELLFGLSFHNRRDHRRKQMLGPFAGITPFRIEVGNRTLTFGELVSGISRQQKADCRHYRYPLGHIRRDAGGSHPLYDTGFNYLRLGGGLPFGECQAELVYLGHNHETAPLMVTLCEHGESDPVELQLDFNLACFNDDDSSLLLNELSFFMKSLENAYPCRLVDLQISGRSQQGAASTQPLSEAEREHLLYELNRTGVEYPRNLCVHELFEAQVQCTPDAVALAYEGEQLSYSELNQQANRLAHYLRSTHSVRPDTLVGLFLERSPQAVIGILGILKAGAGYVPLEPGYPQERLDYMLADSHPAVLLTQDSVAERVASSIIPRLRLDVDIDVLRRYSSDNPSRQAVGLETRHLAYVMYTSGSSGRPKGAMNEHAGVVNRLLWAQQAYGIGRGERILQKTSLSFDVSVWEVLLPLLSGGRVVVARAGGHMDPQYLVDLLEREQVTMVHFVPSMLQVFLEHVEHVEQGRRRVEHGGNEVEKERWWRYLRRVLCSGEALPYGVQQQFRTSLPGVELHNLYGPTEAAIDVTAWRCEEEAHGGVVPIGRPIANTQIYILDEQGELVGMGVTGEIYIGGAGVGRGYWERAEMTAERFVSEPFSGAEGGRMYRSGDVGRWLEDGTIEYLGRLDDQVKIRGFRIELGEIQKRLEQLEEVNKAIVITHPRGSSEQYIIAYVERTFKAGSHTELSNELWANGLRKALRAFLPDFMVPTIIVLDRLPLNPNGKVDIRRLKEFSGQPISPRTCVLPDTQTEIRIVEMWAGLLGVERENVPITARLFDLGGHSLLLIRLFNGIRAELNIELPFHTLFEVVTLRELAARIDAEAALQLMHRKMNSSAVLSEGYL
jgi:amino acid adenylation domain-containing protein